VADPGTLNAPHDRAGPGRVLVVGPAWLGDMVMAQPLYRTLAARGGAVDIVGPPYAFPLLERMPGVRRVWALPVGHGELGLGRRRRLARTLAGEGYDRAIVLPNSWKSALLPWLAGIPRRTGYRGEWRYGLLNDVRVLDRSRSPSLPERYLALGDALAAGAPELEAAPERAAALGLDRARPALALCPGAAFGDAKRWPARHFASLAAARIDAGWQVWLLGGAGDAAATAAVHAALAPEQRAYCVDLAGRTDLGAAADVLSAAAAVVANDSGLLHVAGAVGRPVVGVYGSTSPRFTPPSGIRGHAVGIDLPCRPCFRRTCPLGHRRCLEALEPERVETALAELGVRRD